MAQLLGFLFIVELWIVFRDVQVLIPTRSLDSRADSLIAIILWGELLPEFSPGAECRAVPIRRR